MKWDDRVLPSTLLTRPATDPDKGETVRAFVIQLIALATGIIAAHVCNLRLFGHLMGGTPPLYRPSGMRCSRIFRARLCLQPALV